MRTNYSIETSLPAYHEDKSTQVALVERLITEGVNNLKWLEEKTGLPQSTLAGRVNDLAKEKKVMYSGFTRYKDRLRKRIVVFKLSEQGILFG